MPAPKVSVVVRSIARPTLVPALASIAAQGYPSVEVVVVAASGDAHPLIAAACGPYPIRSVRSPACLPRADAADAGMRATTGDWITFLDDDDEMLPGHIAGLVASAETMPEARAVTGRALATWRDGHTTVVGQRFALAELCQYNFVPISTLLFHRSLLDAGIAFDRRLALYEDWDFVLQIAQHTRFADWPRPTFRWNADAGTSGGGGPENFDKAACDKHRDYIYAKWAESRDALVERTVMLVERAAAAVAAGRLDEAAAGAHELLAFSQNDPDALNLLAMVAIRQGDRAAALRWQTLAVEVRPRDPDLRYNLALVRLAGRDIEGGRDALGEALSLDPEHARAAAKMRELGAAVAPSSAPGDVPRR